MSIEMQLLERGGGRAFDNTLALVGMVFSFVRNRHTSSVSASDDSSLSKQD